MKKLFLISGIVILLITISLASPSCGLRSGAKGPDTLKVNTTDLGKEVIGFNGQTPVEISVCKGVVTGIKVLPNRESPAYLKHVLESGLLDALVGKSVEDAKSTELDAVSGATYTSTALIRNIQLGLEEF